MNYMAPNSYHGIRRSSMVLAVCGCLLSWVMVLGQSTPTENTEADIGFIGLHGGVYEQLQSYAPALSLRLKYFDDATISNRTAELHGVKVLFIQHTREEDRDAYATLISAAKLKSPELRIIAFQPNTLDFFRGIKIAEVIESDPKATSYYGSSHENLRRLLVYIAATYLHRNLAIEPPQVVDREGLYHPEHQELFKSAEEFLVWSRGRGPIRTDQARVLIAVHSTHLFFQQPRVVDALILEAEKQGMVAVAILDGRSKTYEEQSIAFAPHVVIHTCHSTDAPSLRANLDVPHLHSIFIRKQSIEEWQSSVEGLSSSELAFHVIGQELLGAIEPQVAGGLTEKQSQNDAFQPIPERVQHLIARAKSYAVLSQRSTSEKKIAIVYYDREMGKGELMRGSATGMHMNGPRSLLAVLSKMKDRGYSISPLPRHEDQLLGWMMERGRQIGVWAPAELDRLVRFGDPVLIPAKTYQTWYEQKVSPDRRKQMEEKWGPAPGRFMVWKGTNEDFIVVPRIDLGNTILLPQPLRGELHGKESASAQTHDKSSTPPHNYLATYFWLEQEFAANAIVHFGTHGSEFALPGKPNGLSSRDWPDIIMGAMPNFNPWIIENMVESSPVKRRVFGTLISHLPPPIVNAGIHDELSNLHETIDKWNSMEDGALKNKFAMEITRLVHECRLDIDLHLVADESTSTLNDQQIELVSNYLRDIQEETIPTSLHVFGQPPPAELLSPYLLTILRKPFCDALEEMMGRVSGQDPEQTRQAGIRILTSLIQNGLGPKESLELEMGRTLETVPEKIEQGLKLAIRLKQDFGKTTDEIDNLLRGFDGKFVPPGPGNSPIRNPSAVPTGRNMYLLNPEEIPTRPSWELGKKLVADLIERHQKLHGEFPTKIGFDLRSSATFRDYGVMEAQILALIGVEPVWDDRLLVNDLRLIPREELGRPRIDVFIAAGSWYESNLPTRLNLWDKAIRLVSHANEPDNPIFVHSKQTESHLNAQGMSSERASLLSHGRIFGRATGRESGSMLGYSVARSGDWTERQEIADEYLASVKHVYTEGAWGEEAAPLYDSAIQGTHTVIRSWSDHMTGPLASKYTWLQGGSLSLAVEAMTGKRPEYLFSDVRDPDKAGMITSEDALRREFRTRLFNRKWLEGMQKEGYAGADHIRVMVSNSFGWEVMRPGSIGNDQWLEMKRVIVDDHLNLKLREWFDTNNPYAYQDATATMLEAIRKGFWEADAETLQHLTSEYAESVAQHGPSGNITSGGNQPLKEFVVSTLTALANDKSNQVLASYLAVLKKETDVDSMVPVESTPIQITSLFDASNATSQQNSTTPPSLDQSAPQANSNPRIQTAQLEQVTGAKLEPVEEQQPATQSYAYAGLVLATAALFIMGFLYRRGV